MIITIDTGTTNTRVSLFKGNQRLDMVKADVGVRNTSIDGNNQKIVATLAGAVNQLKQRHNIKDSDLEAIVAAGMITSNLGLVEVPHLVAPVSLDDFAKNIHTETIDEISLCPIHFIPGVKNLDNTASIVIDGQDIMRGEEVEALAIAEHYGIEKHAIIALPGSHSKFVSINGEQTILGCCTTLAGELNAIVTHHTILTGSLENRFTDALCHQSLAAGYEETSRFGFGKALFSIRLNEQFGHWQHHELASFLVGAIMYSDIKALSQMPQLGFDKNTPVYIGGSGILCEATEVLLKHAFPDIEVFLCSKAEDLSAMGAMVVARKAGLVG